MGNRSQLCCFPIEVAVRIIGTVSLIIFGFVFVLLCSGVKDVLKNVKVRIILGVDSRFFLQEQPTEIDWYPVFCLAFSAVSVISSALLIFSSLTKQRLMTAPWLVCSVANIVSHLGSFALLGLSNVTSCDKWVTFVAVLYTVLTIYFCIVVLVAQYSWRESSVKNFVRPSNQDAWENVFRPPPPPTESPYKNQI